jgi:hypothetical protein
MKTLILFVLCTIGLLAQPIQRVWSPKLEDSVKNAISDTIQAYLLHPTEQPSYPLGSDNQWGVYTENAFRDSLLGNIKTAATATELSSVITAAGSVRWTVLITDTITLTGAQTFPANVTLQFTGKGMIRFVHSVSYTIDSKWIAPVTQHVFSPVNQTDSLVVSFSDDYMPNARQWGMKTSVSDSTGNFYAFKNLWNTAARSQTGIYVPQGTYYITSIYIAPEFGFLNTGIAINWYGDGQTKSAFQHVANRTGYMFYIKTNNNHNVVYRDIGFVGNETEDSVLVNLNGYSTSLQNIWIRNSGGVGLRIYGGQTNQWNIYNCEFELNDSIGLELIDVNGGSIIGVSIESNGYAGLRLQYCRYMTISNLYSEGTPTQVIFDSCIVIQYNGTGFAAYYQELIVKSYTYSCRFDLTQAFRINVVLDSTVKANTFLLPYGFLHEVTVTGEDVGNNIFNGLAQCMKDYNASDRTAVPLLSYSNPVRHISSTTDNLPNGNFLGVKRGSIFDDPLGYGITESPADSFVGHVALSGYGTYISSTSLNIAMGDTLTSGQTYYIQLLAYIPQKFLVKWRVRKEWSPYNDWGWITKTWKEQIDYDDFYLPPSNGNVTLYEMPFVPDSTSPNYTYRIDVAGGDTSGTDFARFYYINVTDKPNAGLIHSSASVITGYGFNDGFFTSGGKPPANKVIKGSRIFNTSTGKQEVSDGTNWNATY